MKLSGYYIKDNFLSTDRSALYRGQSSDDHTNVVVKTIPQEIPSPNQVECLQQEWRFLSQLSKTSGIIHARELQPVGQSYALVMDDGGSPIDYQTFLEASQGFDFDKFFDVAKQAAKAIDGIHDAHIIHRDLKPKNFLWNETFGTLSIIDFSVATQITHENPAIFSDEIQGSLPYVSPEQTGRMNRPVDYRTDFYSLGITLYECLTGVLPFKGEETADWIYAHLTQTPLNLHQKDSNIPKALAAIIDKLMSKNADERYQCGTSLLFDLEKAHSLCRTGKKDSTFQLGTRDCCRILQPNTKVYGRGPELQKLQRYFNASKNDKAQLVLLSGVSGEGKSALVQTFFNTIGKQNAYLIEGKCEELQKTRPYLSVKNALRDLIFQLLKLPEKKLTPLKRKLNETLQPSGQVIIDIVPEAEKIIGTQPKLSTLGPAESINRLKVTFENFIKTIAQPESPIVMFLDDLQWSESSALNLIEHWLLCGSLQNVFIIGSYRKNQVDADHPLYQVLSRVVEHTPVNKIHLFPLKTEDIQDLLSDTLHCNKEAVIELASIVAQRTQGTPFYVNQFIQAINKAGHLYYESANNRWEWDKAAISKSIVTENMAEYLLEQLEKMPQPTINTLSLAACVGHQFSIQQLCVLTDQSSEAITNALFPAEYEGFIARVETELTVSSSDIAETELKERDAEYQFLHDQIQQACYEALDEEVRKDNHLKAARLLLHARNETNAQEFDLFVIVRHFNRALDRIQNEKERITVSQLNLEAGQECKSASAFETATELLEAAKSLLPENCWESHYTLTVDIHAELASALYLSKHHDEAEALLTHCIEKSHTDYEKALLYKRKISLHSYDFQFKKAFESARTGLKLLGVKIPSIPTKQHVLKQYLISRFKAPLIKTEDISSLEQTTDEKTLLIIDILGSVIPTSYILYGPPGTVFISLKGLNSNPKNEITYSQCICYITQAMFCMSVIRREDAGYQFARFGLEVCDYFPHQNAYKACVHFGFGFSIVPWSQHIKHAQTHFQIAIDTAAENGDFFNAGWACMFIPTYSFYQGEALEKIEQSIQSGNRFLLINNQKELLTANQLTQYLIDLLRGAPAKLTHEEFAQKRLISDAAPAPRAIFASIGGLTHYILGDSEQALFLIENLSEQQWEDDLTAYQYAESRFLYCMVYARLCRKNKKAYLEKALHWGKKSLAFFKRKMAKCPENFAHKYYLMLAEMQRIKGQVPEAQRSYQKAMESAQKEGFTSIHAMACELAGEFYLDNNMPDFAGIYLSRALKLYQQWGAHKKCDLLYEKHQSFLSKTGAFDSRYATLSPGTHPTQTLPHATTQTQSRTTIEEKLDIEAAISASQALAEEFVLEELIRKLLGCVMKNAGAEHALLILKGDKGFSIVAETDNQQKIQLLEESIDNEKKLPLQIINYCIQSNEPVVLESAYNESDFTDDPYIHEHEIQSLLCVPLTNHKKLLGLLYLENNHIPAAFNKDRLKIVQFIASQAGISLQNAELYQKLTAVNESLEETVKKRTAELAESQKELLAYSRQAGMSEVATSVLHNIGNVLNSANVSASLLKNGIQSASTSKLTKLSKLLEQFRQEWDTFFTENPKGQKVPQYIIDLAGVFEKEQTKLLKEMEAIESALEHIKSIVVAQQSYATVKTLLEPVDITKLIDDCLRLQDHSWKAHSITLVKKYDELPTLMIDKARVMQIIINLISNSKHALKAREEAKRTLTINIQRDNEKFFSISISDNGKGIPSQILSRIFEYGFTTKQEGHGFGLHHCANSAVEMGGKLTACSEGENKGASFKLQLPFQEP